MYDKEVLEEVENVMHKEDTEDDTMVNQVGNSMQWMHAKRQIERQRQQCTNRNSTVIGVFLEQGFIEIELTKS